jgi:transposase
MAISITRQDFTAARLRVEASRAPDVGSVLRMLALALVLEGKSRTEAATSCGMDRQTLRDWVHRYNAEGLAGLTDRPRSGRPPRLRAAQEAERFGVELAERTVAKLLKKLRFTRLSPRPYHPKKNAEAQEAFKKTSPPA